MTDPHILLLPGWKNSDAGHWQSRWEALYRDRRVEQHEWLRPLRGDWSARLEDEVLAAPGPVVFAAHSLGCILVAAWAAHSRNTHRVRGALLVGLISCSACLAHRALHCVGWQIGASYRVWFPHSAAMLS